MKYVVIKSVYQLSDTMFGCVVGPFKTKQAAEEYAEKAGKFNLGYEEWEVVELQLPAKL
jgi:hypothetical protein